MNWIREKIKVVGFFIITIFITFVILDLGLQLIYYLSTGLTTWEKNNEVIKERKGKEYFNVRGFTKVVKNKQYVTMKINYNKSNKEIKYVNWSIITDHYGFRVGLNKVSKTGDNIIFIGDSVPFGWGIDGNDTVPSKLYQYLRSKNIQIGVVNAAVPSYTLSQAVHRYKNEIANKFNKKITILQVYDPASQFSIYGPLWKDSMNWTTTWKIKNNLKDKDLTYSAIYYICSRLYKLYYALDRYKKSIVDNLNIIKQYKQKNEKIIILPVTIPKLSWTEASVMRKLAIYILNNTMKEYSNKYDTFYYLDTVKYFSTKEDNDVFRDKCCHLSPNGAILEAKYIGKYLIEKNIIKDKN